MKKQHTYFLTLSFATSMMLHSHQQNDFSIVKSTSQPTTYEQIWLTQLRDEHSTREQFRIAAHKLIEALVIKVYDCLQTKNVTINTPVTTCNGIFLDDQVEHIVSVMRSGDIPLTIFSKHFPYAAINKILVQRNEETAEPIFKYRKFASSIAHAKKIIITEPMIATGGTLCMVINLLKDHGVEEKNIIIAAICAAPEGLRQLAGQFPEISVVLTVIDDHLNEKKYISPGLGDFGDRYFGTE